MATLDSPAIETSAADLSSLPMHRFTVDQYHRMIEAGVFQKGERVQLIDGWIIQMTPIGPGHSYVVTKLNHLLSNQLPAGYFTRVQQPVTLRTSEPEPDIAVVAGRIEDHTARHPRATEVALIIEVADSSVAFDRSTKAAVYAAEGIAEYWVLNLPKRRVEVFDEPEVGTVPASYRRRQIVEETGTLTLRIGDQTIALAAKDFLP